MRVGVIGADLIATADPVRPATYRDGFDLIAAPDVEGVVIASPVITHEAYVLACLEAGKPVLCEKRWRSTPPRRDGSPRPTRPVSSRSGSCAASTPATST